VLLKLLRNGLGYLIIFISFFIPVKRLGRATDEQKCVDETTSTITLYQFYACPFCLKTRRALKKLGLNIQTRNALKDPARADLLAGGGEIKVPCLRIESKDEVIWMYESSEIIAYLEQRFGENSTPCSELNY
jgi:glutaredoxin